MKKQNSINVITSLRQRWLIYVILSLLFISYAYRIIASRLDYQFISNYFLMASGVLIIQAWGLWGILSNNHRQNKTQLLPTFGLGNNLSLVRGTLIASVAGFIFLPRPVGLLSWMPAILYFLASIMDYFDGYLARISNHVTLMGEDLDIRNDSLGVLMATMLAYHYGVVPWWYAIFGFARYFFLIGLWYRKHNNLPVFELIPSMKRRIFAAVQMGFIAVVLFPVIGPPSTTAAASLFLIPFTGQFLSDWYQVSGRRNTDNPEIIWWEKIEDFGKNWLPIVFRTALIGLIIVEGIIYLSNTESAIFEYTQQGLSNPGGALLIFMSLDLIYSILIAFGIAGRSVAILFLVTAGIRLQFNVFDLRYWIILLICFTILFLGTGKYSMWEPEEWLWQNRAGEK